jgi:hypothetical protein
VTSRPKYARGEVVLVPFPVPGKDPAAFRIALILLAWPWNERATHYLLCFVDTIPSTDPYAIPLGAAEFGAEPQHEFYIRPTYLMTVSEARIEAQVGKLSPEKFRVVLDTLFDALYEEIESEESE